jgi:hypothetical protein
MGYIKLDPLIADRMTAGGGGTDSSQQSSNRDRPYPIARPGLDDTVSAL